jgi:uncharacterized coiled-coil protein SlyX
MQDTEARLLALENTVKQQQKAIDSFDRMFISTLAKFQQLDEELYFFGKTVDTMLLTEENMVTKTVEFYKAIKKLNNEVVELWQDFQFRQVRKRTDMLN